ncbi:MAG: hypothetical protein LUQ07_02480 [Methanospirillum sp.]|nr:hypothetical protein [Methanospirillum sp.]
MRYILRVKNIGLLLAFLLIIPLVSAETDTPSLIGTWQIDHHERDSETSDYKESFFNETDISRYVIETQTDQIFEGYKEVEPKSLTNHSVEHEGFTGVITDDGMHAYIQQHEEGITIVDIKGTDSLTLYNLVELDLHGDDNAGASRISLVRVNATS